MARLSKEEIVTIQVLKQQEQSASAIARALKVTEGTVRYHERRASEGALDGRAKQVQVAATSCPRAVPRASSVV